MTLSYRQDDLRAPQARKRRATVCARRAGLRVVLGSHGEGDPPEGRGARRSPAASEETIPNDAVFTMIGREPPLPFLAAIRRHDSRRVDRREVGRAPRSSWRSACSSTTGRPAARSTGRSQEPRRVPVRRASGVGRSGVGVHGPRERPRHDRAVGGLAGLLLLARLLSVRSRVRHQAHPKTQDALRDVQTVTLTADPGRPALPASLRPAPVDGAQRLVRPGNGTMARRSALPRDRPATLKGASTGARSASSSRGRCSSGTCSARQPMALWLAISVVQTFVIIPPIICRWGKGAYCGWICSCGALAETLGDAHRQKMPHGQDLEPAQHGRAGRPRGGARCSRVLRRSRGSGPARWPHALYDGLLLRLASARASD